MNREQYDQIMRQRHGGGMNAPYPNTPYPNAQYPNRQYPNSQYPNTQQYPNRQYPGNPYPTNTQPRSGQNAAYRPELVDVINNSSKLSPYQQAQPQIRLRQDTNTLQPEPLKDRKLSFKTFIPLIAGIILMLFSSISGGAMAMWFGLGLMGTGIMAYKELADYKPEKKLTAALFAAGGGTMAVAGMFSMLFPMLSGTLTLGAMTLLGTITAVGPRIASYLKKKRCTEKIRGVCIGNRWKRSSGKHHRLVYAPIWQYIFGGRTFVHYDTVYTSPQQFCEGEGTDLYVNPNDPQDIYRSNDPSGIALAVVGGMMALIGIIGFISSHF